MTRLKKNRLDRRVCRHVGVDRIVAGVVGVISHGDYCVRRSGRCCHGGYANVREAKKAAHEVSVFGVPRLLCARIFFKVECQSTI